MKKVLKHEIFKFEIRKFKGNHFMISYSYLRKHYATVCSCMSYAEGQQFFCRHVIKKFEQESFRSFEGFLPYGFADSNLSRTRRKIVYAMAKRLSLCKTKTSLVKELIMIEAERQNVI